MGRPLLDIVKQLGILSRCIKNPKTLDEQEVTATVQLAKDIEDIVETNTKPQTTVDLKPKPKNPVAITTPAVIKISTPAKPSVAKTSVVENPKQ